MRRNYAACEKARAKAHTYSQARGWRPRRLRLALPPATIRHRLEAWAAPSIAAGRSVADVAVPMLVVAGTADLRVPAVEEAERFAAEAGAAVHLVEGAGHAGVTDDRLDLRRVMRSWRDAG